MNIRIITQVLVIILLFTSAIPLVCAQAQFKADLNVTSSVASGVAAFGAAETATEGFDRTYDEPQPPVGPVNTYLQAYFYYPNNTYTPPGPPNATAATADSIFSKLTTSYIALGDSLEWPLKIDYKNATGGFTNITIAWNLSEVPEEYLVSLHTDEGVINMRERLSYTVNTSKSSESYEFNITAAKPSESNIAYSNLIVAPTSGTAPLDITASAKVENTGGVAGDYNATLKVDGTVVNYTTGTLNAGENVTVSFMHTLPTAGTYSVTIDELTAEEVTVSEPADITSWGNDKTNDDSLHITLNESESIRFNATADQTITTWNWFKDGVHQSNTSDNYTTSWSVNGTYTVSVNATNANRTSDTKMWTIIVGSDYDPADTNQNCVVDMMELMAHISKWKSGEVGMMELMTSIGRWKLGTGGYC